MKPWRLVIDTNVVISALLFQGEANKIHSLWREKKIQFIVSREIVEEYIKVLTYPKFRLSAYEIKGILQEQILPFVESVKVHSHIDLVAQDPEDNKFLSLALDGRAKYLLTGDRHLLEIKRLHKCQCLGISEFLQKYKSHCNK